MKRSAQRLLVTGAIGALSASALAGCESPANALARAVAQADYQGVYSFVSVVDRSTGAVVARTGNADTQVAAESIMKLLLAAYYLKSYGGFQNTPASVLSRLAYMIQYSDDDTASALFSTSAIPSVASWYGLGGTTNAHGNPGYWGAARITASDMARFMFQASRDGQVGPWLLQAMAGTAATGSGADRNWNQLYGLNALSGTRGSKQGWGCDSYWTEPRCGIHSVGYTDRYFVSILQLSSSFPGAMPATATNTARRIQSSVITYNDGDFVVDQRNGAVYRIAGGAPIYVSNWSAVGGAQPTRPISGAALDGMRAYPKDGTFVRDASSGAVYRIAGGAPIHVSSWQAVGGPKPVVNIDGAAIARAGTGGRFNHLRQQPADGTFIRDTTNGAVYRVAGGAPIHVSTWSVFPPGQTCTDIDGAAIARAGSGGVWSHVARRPTEGTFIRDARSLAVFQIVGGAPLHVTSWAPFGGPRPVVDVDGFAIANAGKGPVLGALSYWPQEGTRIKGVPGNLVYTIGAKGVLRAAEDPTAPAALVNQAIIDRAGTPPAFLYDHLAPGPQP